MRVYVETSVISFWYDQHQRNREKRRAVRRFLLSCARGTHEGFVSVLVRDELEDSREPYRSRDLKLITRLGLKDSSSDQEKFLRLLEAYRRDPLISRLPERDHGHLALIAPCELEALLTSTLNDLANQSIP